MYCGSCARDNALARELLARGHDVTLIPVYTPTRTDEPNVSRQRVLFGGISVYLQHYVTLFRNMPRFIDRFWDSPGVIGAFAGRMVSNDPKMLGELTLSMLDGESGVLRREFEKLLEWIRAEPLPDIINLPNSLLISLAEPLRRELNRPSGMHAAGRGTLHRGPDGAVPIRGAGADPFSGQSRRSLHSGQSTIARNS